MIVLFYWELFLVKSTHTIQKMNKYAFILNAFVLSFSTVTFKQTSEIKMVYMFFHQRSFCVSVEGKKTSQNEGPSSLCLNTTLTVSA